MKKRLLILGILIIITLLVLQYMLNITLRKSILQEEFASMFPATPLAYVQCSQLQARLEHFMNSPDYHTFIQSEFAKQVQQTKWWSDFSFSFEQFWNSLIIDPMRIIGTDAAVAVYKEEEGEIIPGIILVSKVDRVAKIAERIFYVFDKVTGQMGITFEQDYQRVSIYAIEQPDMICPLYYTIIDNIGMISTSRSLLKSSIRLSLSRVAGAANEIDTFSVNTSPFRKTLRNIPDQRFVTGYLDLSLFFNELRENNLFRPLRLYQGSAWQKEGGFPFVAIHLNTHPDSLILRTELFSASNILEYPGDSSENAENNFLPQEKIPTNLPIVATLYREKFTSFLQNWQEFFPQWEWVLPIQMLEQTQGIFGETLECSISEMLLGTFYTIPDIACVLDTQHPGRSMAFFNLNIKNILAQMFPSMAQQALVKMSNESYQNTRIAMIHIMFQEIFSYAIARSGDTRSQNTYTILATNGNKLKNRIDLLQAHPGKQPYVLTPRQNGSAFVFLLKNDGLSELIQNISQTNTFFLMYPRQTYGQLYQNLPFLIQLLKPLPPVLIEGGTKGTRLYLELRFHGKAPRDESRG